jgi:hypothetical protein
MGLPVKSNTWSLPISWGPDMTSTTPHPHTINPKITRRRRNPHGFHHRSWWSDVYFNIRRGYNISITCIARII